MVIEFQGWPKTPRLFRDMVITEKIDGTNAAVVVTYVPDGPSPQDYWDAATMTALVEAQPAGWESPGDFIVSAQSRKRLITPDVDNHGFAQWVRDNATALADALGEGRHYGEWWGSGIQRGYGLRKGEKRFSLFNVKRYVPLLDVAARPHELNVVPILHEGPFDTKHVSGVLDSLVVNGSKAAPGFDRPEGIIVFHAASGQVFKVTVEGDEAPKSVVKAENLPWSAPAAA